MKRKTAAERRLIASSGKPYKHHWKCEYTTWPICQTRDRGVDYIYADDKSKVTCKFCLELIRIKLA